MKCINGNNFAEIADHVITLDSPVIPFDTEKVNVIFCKTDFLSDLFNYLIQTIQRKKYTLITGMADKEITKYCFDKKPDCIDRWFAVNATYDHPRLYPIPLGIENHKGRSKGKYTNHPWLYSNLERLRDKDKEESVYCNFNQFTNKKARVGAIPKLKEKGIDLTISSFTAYEQYCEEMSECKYVLCPPGNGVDTHRLWEALYMGCIPITLESRIYRDYDLPIIQVKHWDELNEDLLNMDRLYNYKELYMSYWKEKIIR